MPRSIANGVIELVEKTISVVDKLGAAHANPVGERRIRQLRQWFPPNSEDVLTLRTVFNRVLHPYLFDLELGDGSFMDGVNLYLTSREMMPSASEARKPSANPEKDDVRKAWRKFYAQAETGDDVSKWAAYIDWEHRVVKYAAPRIEKSLAYREHLRRLSPERLEAERRQRREIITIAAGGLGSLAWVLGQLDKLPDW